MRRRYVQILLLFFTFGYPPTWGSTAEPEEGPEPRTPNSIHSSAERTQDSLWLVGTRHLGYPSRYDPDKLPLQVMKHDWAEGWLDSDLDTFLDTNDPSIVTAVYVHGNRVDRGQVFQRGMLAYRALVRGLDDPQPIRFVVWSWPSTKRCGPLRDVRSKATRSDYDSYYLGTFLSRLNPQTRVGMYGFSYGSRVISGALHLVGGGKMLGLTVPDAQPKEERTAHAALMGAAMNNYWLLPGYRHGKALSQMDRLLVQYNPCDRILRMYRFAERRSRPQALGHAALPGLSALEDEASRIEQQNVCPQIGNNHDARFYFASPGVMNAVRQCVLWQ
ncbi:MAG: hypothetical protein H8E44_43865 [Planctomycetes bacterium]|nr:hypothetical protein [Planctomycetota bacterium]MBL7041229.1 hypothetical protein [Pirellulaceae bacterium]